MSAADDYQKAKALLLVDHPADAIRAWITSTRIEERDKATNLLKLWSDQLEDSEPFVAMWFRKASDALKTNVTTLPKFKPDFILEAESEDDL